jgi:hypothetical protein
MRHLKTLIAAIVVGPLAWILLALGQGRSSAAFGTAQDTGTFNMGQFVQTALLLAGAGVLLGLIATLRLSPLGAVLTGAVYAGSYLAMATRPGWLLSLLGHKLSVAGQRIDLATPVRSGTTMLLGAALLVAVVSVQRWRRWPGPDAEASDLDAFERPSAPVAQGVDRPLGAEGLGMAAAERTGDHVASTDDIGDQLPTRVGSGHWADAMRGNSDARR